jgi:hypothetical protein
MVWYITRPHIVAIASLIVTLVFEGLDCRIRECFGGLLSLVVAANYGINVSLAVFITPAYEAEMVTILFTKTAFVFTVK